jgi:SAM-dependent methyltransferase
VAIDPAATTPEVRAVPLHELDEPAGSFDAAVAVVSLHHVEPLEESCRRLGGLVRPGGVLVIDELDVERLDERAASWWLDRREQAGEGAHHGGNHHGPDEVVADMRRHLHTLARIRGALGEDFAIGEPVRGPYLHRWYLPAGLREDEEDAIAAGRIPAIGARLVGIRRERSSK